MAPEILKVGDVENATAQGWKATRETTRIINSEGFLLPQKREIWNLGHKRSFQIRTARAAVGERERAGEARELRESGSRRDGNDMRS